MKKKISFFVFLVFLVLIISTLTLQCASEDSLEVLSVSSDSDSEFGHELPTTPPTPDYDATADGRTAQILRTPTEEKEASVIKFPKEADKYRITAYLATQNLHRPTSLAPEIRRSDHTTTSNTTALLVVCTKRKKRKCVLL